MSKQQVIVETGEFQLGCAFDLWTIRSIEAPCWLTMKAQRIPPETKMRGSEFAELAAFVAIADQGSFVKAAAVLGVSTSTLSKMIMALEERLDTRLFNRTTRSIALTDVAKRLLVEVRPALDRLGMALESVEELRHSPTGVLRLNVSSLAAAMVIAPTLNRFNAAYPAITLDISVKDGSINLVADGFDAGIRRDRRIEQDMIAVRVSRESRIVTVSSPAYFAEHPAPRTPNDLKKHNCIRFRLSDGTIAKWEFEKSHRKVTVPVAGSLIVDNVGLMLRGALEGVGIAYVIESYVESFVREQRLVPVLEDWSLQFSGWHIYYPSRRQIRTPLKVFIDLVRSTSPLS